MHPQGRFLVTDRVLDTLGAREDWPGRPTVLVPPLDMGGYSRRTCHEGRVSWNHLIPTRGTFCGCGIELPKTVAWISRSSRPTRVVYFPFWSSHSPLSLPLRFQTAGSASMMSSFICTEAYRPLCQLHALIPPLSNTSHPHNGTVQYTQSNQ